MINNKNKVDIKYVSKQSGVSNRIIHPAEMFYYLEDWYVAAFCETKKDIRLFKLTDILEYKVLDNKYENFEIYNFRLLGSKQETIDLRVYSDSTNYPFVKQEDGSYTSSNEGVQSSYSHSYIIYDLRNQTDPINVYINTKSMKDRELAESMNAEVQEMMDKYCQMASEVYASVAGRLH